MTAPGEHEVVEAIANALRETSQAEGWDYRVDLDSNRGRAIVTLVHPSGVNVAEYLIHVLRR